MSQQGVFLEAALLLYNTVIRPLPVLADVMFFPSYPLYTYGTLIPVMGPVYVKAAESSRPFCYPVVLDEIRRD